MKTIMLFALLLITLCSGPRAEAQLFKEKQETIARLIEDIPSMHSARRYLEAIGHPETVGPEGVAFARERIALAKVAVPKLRALIQIDTSIFDYPGLIARGHITYSKDRSRQGNHLEYCLWVSATYVGKEASILPYEFELYFDDNGVIRKIEERRWKK